MKEKEFENVSMAYKSPRISVIELKVQQMIAASLNGSTEGYGENPSSQLEGYGEENGTW